MIQNVHIVICESYFITLLANCMQFLSICFEILVLQSLQYQYTSNTLLQSIDSDLKRCIEEDEELSNYF